MTGKTPNLTLTILLMFVVLGCDKPTSVNSENADGPAEQSLKQSYIYSFEKDEKSPLAKKVNVHSNVAGAKQTSIVRSRNGDDRVYHGAQAMALHCETSASCSIRFTLDQKLQKLLENKDVKLSIWSKRDVNVYQHIVIDVQVRGATLKTRTVATGEGWIESVLNVRVPENNDLFVVTINLINVARSDFFLDRYELIVL